MTLEKPEEKLPEEEKAEKEAKMRIELSIDAKEKALGFARAILRVLGEDRNKRDEFIEKFLGVKRDKCNILTADFKFYQRSQAIYAANLFPTKSIDCKIIKVTNITDEGERAPTYERIQIKPDKKISLLTIGEFLLEWKNEKIILEIYFCGYTRRIRLYSKNIELASDFQDEFMRFMKTQNFLKGKRLIFLPRSEIDFLEFPKLNWKDVILKQELTDSIMLNIIFPITNEKKCTEIKIPWRRGVLMGSVAGTGKTQVCRILCNVLPDSTTLIWATPKALYESEKIQDLFEAARYFSPTLIIIEDIDFIGTSRDFVQNPILGELLTQLDGNDPNHGIFVIATTNRPEQLDVALANRPSRFDVKLEFSLPEENERIELMKLFTKGMKFDQSIDYKKIAAISNGLTGAHIKEIFVYAQLKALKRGSKKISFSDVEERVKQYKADDGSRKAYTE